MIKMTKAQRTAEYDRLMAAAAAAMKASEETTDKTLASSERARAARLRVKAAKLLSR